MKTSSIIKKIVILIIVVIIAAVIYNMFFKSKAPTGALTSSNPVATTPTGGVTETAVGRELLATLLNLRTIKLNEQIFSNPSFTSLQDFTITLVGTGNEGRPNPFAPIGADQAGGQGAPATASVATAPATNITKNTATLGGVISSNTGTYSGWFEWNKVGATTPAIKTATVTFPGTITSFSAPLTGLLPSTPYTYKVFVKIGDLTLPGASVAFTTPAN